MVGSFVVVLGATVALLFGQDQLGAFWSWSLAAWIAWGVLDLGAFFEDRRWAVPVELARLSVVVASGGWLVLRGEAGVGTGLVALGAVSIAWLLSATVVVRRRRRAAGSPVERPGGVLPQSGER